jgi:uncharacterized protein (TIGR03435 family)
MIRTIVGSSLIVFASYAAFGQTAPLAFEAASLKPTANPGKDGRIMRQMNGGPGSTDPGRFTYSNITLKMLVQMAYDLKEFQVEGPEWIDSEGFDLIATMPPGTTQAQASGMMQTLLADRFKLVFHRETKPMPIYALVVGKNGSKMKEVETPAPPLDGAPPDPSARGGRGTGGPGIRMMMSPNGMRMAGSMTMAQLADQLTRRLARPVLDQTELTKTYDVDLTWMPDDRDGASLKIAAIQAGVGGPSASPSGNPSGDGQRNGAEPAPTLPQALDEKLGLKLEARKSSADMFVIEHAEKTPESN